MSRWLKPPCSCIEQLAGCIDDLEKRLDQFGTITAKNPDVWGQARLTAHRAEYEKKLAAELDGFNKQSVQGAISTTDQAFLATALSVQAAISGRQAAQFAPAPDTIVTRTISQNANDSITRSAARSGSSSVDSTDRRSLSDTFTNTIKSNATREPSGSTTNTTNQSANNTLASNASNSLTGSSTDTGTLDFNQSTKPATALPIPQPAKSVDSMLSVTSLHSNNPILQAMPGFGSGGIAVEQTLVLDQLSRYLGHLHQLRRINEGDDNADSPGYSLNLVRIPVSVLPGERTRKGYGAEITITAEPHISDNLLPFVFQRLVINDLMDELSLPIWRLVNDHISASAKEIRSLLADREHLESTLAALQREQRDTENTKRV